MAGQATPPESDDAVRNRFVELVGSGQGARGAGGGRHAVDVATFACLVCARPANWRIERPLGSYTVCDWCASVIQDYDAEHPELNPSRHVRLASADA